uniref:alpha-L-fucosidase-like n=1 Tax=Ciona intestinalis TaxID=7719 RepID=UPI00006A5430|nr:alpha-L-fucosidase-like [Ciona intestinalis]|eukprot:XP_002132133.1 alpha-L-fucosidase-like [Ciona intestinalis]
MSRFLIYSALLCVFVGYASSSVLAMEKNAMPIENAAPISAKVYNDSWASIDSRPLPIWYDEAKLGIFLHWGVFSVPSFGASPAWGWYYWKVSGWQSWKDYMANNFKPKFSYADFAKDFSTEFYEPDDWADLFAASGARYMALTSKHHEGYCTYPTNVSWNWNSRDVGPHRDLVGELAHSIRSRTSMHFGLYHSLYEWFNPLYIQDKANKFQTNAFVKEKTLPELYEIVNAYKPDLIWSDGQWEAPSWYWNSTVFLSWLYNESPVKDTVVTNDRWGSDTLCKHGGYLTCNDRFNPKTHVPDKKWENAMTLNKGSWSWRRDTDISQFLTLKELLSTFIETISCGGNMLMNVGPTKEGTISPIFGERLQDFGAWMSVNGEAVYGSKPWRMVQDTMDSNVRYTTQVSTGSLLRAQAHVRELKEKVRERKRKTEEKLRAEKKQLEKEFANVVLDENRQKRSVLFDQEQIIREFKTRRGESVETVVVQDDITTDDVIADNGLIIYAFVMEWPQNGILLLDGPRNATSASTIRMLGLENVDIQYTSLQPTGIAIEMPIVPISKLPHHLIWVLKLVGFQ